MKKEEISPKQEVSLMPTFILLPIGLIILVALAISFSKSKQNRNTSQVINKSTIAVTVSDVQHSISSMIKGRDKK